MYDDFYIMKPHNVASLTVLLNEDKEYCAVMWHVTHWDTMKSILRSLCFLNPSLQKYGFIMRLYVKSTQSFMSMAAMYMYHFSASTSVSVTPVTCSWQDTTTAEISSYQSLKFWSTSQKIQKIIQTIPKIQ